MKSIELSQGKVAIVDAADYERLSLHKWCAMKQRHTWYAVRSILLPSGRQTTVYMHREIMGLPSKVKVDHKDGDGLNNWRDNLRSATDQQNCFNAVARKNKSSQYKGVSLFKKVNKWEAYITLDGKQRRLGFFSNEEDAARAYDAAARLLFGEFARFNFPNGEMEMSQ